MNESPHLLALHARRYTGPVILVGSYLRILFVVQVRILQEIWLVITVDMSYRGTITSLVSMSMELKLIFTCRIRKRETASPWPSTHQNSYRKLTLETRSEPETWVKTFISFLAPICAKKWISDARAYIVYATREWTSGKNSKGLA